MEKIFGENYKKGETMNRATKNNINNICVITGILFVFLTIINFEQVKETVITWITEDTYVVITNDIIYIPQDCIDKYYVDLVDRNGFLFLIEPCPDDCEDQYINETTKTMYGNESKEEIDQMALDLFQKVRNLGGNATAFRSVIIYNSETNEIVEDKTEELRESMKKEIYKHTVKI